MSPTNGVPSIHGVASLRREGDYWTLEFDGRVCRLRHAKGISFLAALLAHPGSQVSAHDLDRLAGSERCRASERKAEDPASAEKARLNVTRALRLLLKKVAAYHPSAGGHLAASIKTGMLCSYAPDPILSIDWMVSSDLVPMAVPARDGEDRSIERPADQHGG